MRAIFAGWLIALMVWLLPGTESAGASIITIPTYLVGISGFNHIIHSGSATRVFLVVTQSISPGTYITQFFFPPLLGNVIAGLALVAALGSCAGGRRGGEAGEGKGLAKLSAGDRSL
jgi:formate/nitrite transporter FocA (FNT family)